MNEKIPAPIFPGIAFPSSDFQAVRDGRRGQLFYIDVDLSSARSRAAGTMAVLGISGNFFYIDQRLNAGVARVGFQDVATGATSVTVFPGALWKVPFTQLTIENDAQSGQSIRIIFGTDVDALPISAAGVTVLNPVSVVDGGKTRTLAGVAFMGYGELTGGGATFGVVQLWNKSTDKRLVLESFRPNAPVAGGWVAGFSSAALATLQLVPRSKLAGGANSVSAEIRAEALAAFPGDVLLTDYLLARTPDPVTLSEPIIIPPGEGFFVGASAVNVVQAANFEFYEENV